MGDLPTFVGAGATVLVAAIAGFLKLMHNISAKFTALGDKIDQIMDAHEKRDQDRHEENVQRLTRLETIANANGSYRRARK